MRKLGGFRCTVSAIINNGDPGVINCCVINYYKFVVGQPTSSVNDATLIENGETGTGDRLITRKDRTASKCAATSKSCDDEERRKKKKNEQDRKKYRPGQGRIGGEGPPQFLETGKKITEAIIWTLFSGDFLVRMVVGGA